MKTYGDFFTGFGGATLGAMVAGLQPAWGIEYRADVAEVANANLGDHIRVADVLDVDPRRLDRVDVLHASPPCPNFSQAKAGAVESPHDLALAGKVADFVRVLLPEIFTLENVYGYRNSQSWAIIRETLFELGYWLQMEHVNAADFGVPQTRKRMIVRAVRGGWVPHLPQPIEWVGWYAAIEDLIDTLPESEFAPWQLKRLPEFVQQHTLYCTNRSYDQHGNEYGLIQRKDDLPAMTVKVNGGPDRAFLVSNARTEFGDGLRNAEEPALSVTQQALGRQRAWLVSGGNADHLTVNCDVSPSHTIVANADRAPARASIVGGQYEQSSLVADRRPQQREADEPIWTVTATDHGDTRAWLNQGKVVAMTPRALARFQSFPNWYELPGKRSLAAYGIGNAVPPLLYRRIVEGLL